MKRANLFLLTVFSLLFLPCLAQGQSSIKFESLNNYLGVFKQDFGLIESTFLFENTGTGNIKIEKITTSSGCTVSKYSKNSIIPKNKGFITVVYNSKARLGKFTETIIVTTDQAGASDIKLSISGEIIPKDKTRSDFYTHKSGNLKLAGEFLEFAKLYNSETRSETMKIYNNWDKIMTISYDDTLKFISCEINPRSLEPGQEGIITVTYNATKRKDFGIVIDTVKLSTNDIKQPIKELYIKADIFEDFTKLRESKRKIAPKISFTNTNFDFGLVNEGEEIKYNFEIKNKGIRELIIRKMDPSCSCISIKPKRFKLRQQKTTLINITITTQGYKGQHNETITVISNDPKNPRMKLYIQGEVN